MRPDSEGSSSNPLTCSHVFTDKGIIFGTPLTDSCIAQIFQLIEYLSKSGSSEYIQIYQSQLFLHYFCFKAKSWN